MSIMDMNSRMAMAEKLSVQQLQQAIQSGSLPAYIGIPLIEQKTKEKAQMAAAQQGQEKPPSVVANILQQAEQQEQQEQQEQGIDQLPSNLPVEGAQQGMAGGGIVAFADEGQVREPKVKLDPNNAPTVRELMEVIGGDREKFERLAGGKAFNPKDYTPKEIQAAQLLFSANQTKDPERYLESLNPFHDSQLDYKLRDTNFGGFVSKKEPNTAVIRRLAESESIVPHELTHTLQLRDAARGNTISRDIVPYIEKLSPETKEKIFGTAVNRFDTPREIYANLNDYAMRRNAAGEDFVNSPEGRELLPNRRMQGQYYSNTMPGIQSIYGYREDTGGKFKRDSRDSYATQLAKYAKHKTKDYADGGGIVAFNERGRVEDPYEVQDREGGSFAGRDRPGRPTPLGVTPEMLRRLRAENNPAEMEAISKEAQEFADTIKNAPAPNAPAGIYNLVSPGATPPTLNLPPPQESSSETIGPQVLARNAAEAPVQESETIGPQGLRPIQFASSSAQRGTPPPSAASTGTAPSGAVSPATARQISATNPGAPATLKDAERQAANGSPQAAAAVSMVDKYIAMLEKNGDDVGRQKKEALYMALIQGGLATAGGTSPNAFANLAAGMVPAVQSYQQALAGIRKDDRARIEKLINAGMSKEKLGMELRKLGIEEKKVDAMVNYYNYKATGGGKDSSSLDAKREAETFIRATGVLARARKDFNTATADQTYKFNQQVLSNPKAKPEDKTRAQTYIDSINNQYLPAIQEAQQIVKLYKPPNMQTSGGGGKDGIDLDKFFK